MSRAAPAELRHVPVLVRQAMAALEPRAGGVYVDATFGAGGYARALLDRGATVIAIDRDPAAVRAGAELAASSGGRLRLLEARFGELDAVARRLGVEAADGVVLDIGVSSMQLDEAGAAFRSGSTLLSICAWRREGRSAADILRDEDEATIADILYHFGEERAARRIARAIVADRTAKPFVSTLELAGLIARVAPARRGEIDPSGDARLPGAADRGQRRTGELVRGLAAAERLLKPGGRLAVVTFHSLEDRIVKQFFASRSGRGRSASRRLPGEPAEAEPTFEVSRGQPIEPGEAEALANPRSRSAKLRFGRAHRRAAATNGRSDRGAGATAGATGEMNLMWRLMHGLAIAALIGSAAYVYGVKYRTIYASEKLVKTRHLIDKEKDAINLLRAEYAHLARPDRIQAVAELQTRPAAAGAEPDRDRRRIAGRPAQGRLDRPHPRIARVHGRQRHPGGHRGRLDASGEVKDGRDPDRSRREAQAQQMGASQSGKYAG